MYYYLTHIYMKFYKNVKFLNIKMQLKNLIHSLNNAMQTMCIVVQSCPTLCNSTDCSLPGSSVHGILQAKILEWVAMPSRGSSQPRDQTQVFCIAGGFFISFLYQGSQTFRLFLRVLNKVFLFSITSDLLSEGLRLFDYI